MVPFPPDARNEKAPARSLSGRTSAMIETCVKGGRFVNVVFGFLAKAYGKFRDVLDVATARSSHWTAVTHGVRWMPERTSLLRQRAGSGPSPTSSGICCTLKHQSFASARFDYLQVENTRQQLCGPSPFNLASYFAAGPVFGCLSGSEFAVQSSFSFGV